MLGCCDKTLVRLSPLKYLFSRELFSLSALISESLGALTLTVGLRGLVSLTESVLARLELASFKDADLINLLKGLASSVGFKREKPDVFCLVGMLSVIDLIFGFMLMVLNERCFFIVPTSHKESLAT